MTSRFLLSDHWVIEVPEDSQWQLDPLGVLRCAPKDTIIRIDELNTLSLQDIYTRAQEICEEIPLNREELLLAYLIATCRSA